MTPPAMAPAWDDPLDSVVGFGEVVVVVLDGAPAPAPVVVLGARKVSEYVSSWAYCKKPTILRRNRIEGVICLG